MHIIQLLLVCIYGVPILIGCDSNSSIQTDSDDNGGTAGDADTEVDTSDWTTTTNPDAPAPMPLISRGVPAFSSSGVGSRANDDSYSTYWWSPEIPAWLAYDLSQVPSVKRGRILVHWINDSYSYYSTSGGVTRSPRIYSIDAHAGAGGGEPPAPGDSGWVTLIDVTTPFTHHSRQHEADLTDGETVYNWLRLYVSEVNGPNQTVNLNMDVHDAHLGVEDSWFFTGDSLTSGAMRLIERDDENFPQIINRVFAQYNPAQENAGVGGWQTEDGAEHVPGWLDHFPGRYVAISFGTNDTGANVTGDEFYANYEIMVQAVISRGKIPVIPTIPWFRQPRADQVPGFNAKLVELKQAYPQILDGPDFWAFFSANQHLIGDDDLHPTEPEGDLAYRRLWAETMISVVYYGL